MNDLWTAYIAHVLYMIIIIMCTCTIYKALDTRYDGSNLQKILQQHSYFSRPQAKMLYRRLVDDVVEISVLLHTSFFSFFFVHCLLSVAKLFFWLWGAGYWVASSLAIWCHENLQNSTKSPISQFAILRKLTLHFFLLLRHFQYFCMRFSGSLEN